MGNGASTKYKAKQKAIRIAKSIEAEEAAQIDTNKQSKQKDNVISDSKAGKESSMYEVSSDDKSSSDAESSSSSSSDSSYERRKRRRRKKKKKRFGPFPLIKSQPEHFPPLFFYVNSYTGLLIHF